MKKYSLYNFIFYKKLQQSQNYKFYHIALKNNDNGKIIKIGYSFLKNNISYYFINRKFVLKLFLNNQLILKNQKFSFFLIMKCFEKSIFN